MSLKSLMKKLAAEYYDALSGRGDKFTRQDVIDALVADPSLDGLAEELLDLAAEAAVKDIDTERTKRDNQQQDLFGDNDRTVALGNNERRRKGACDLDDISRHMALVMDNAARVAEAASKEQREFSLLLPYLQGGLVWEEAANFYESEHGNGAGE